MTDRSHREELLAEVRRLASKAILGSLSETFRTCGSPSCRCHTTGPKHGPHAYVSFRSAKTGRSTGYYVPADAVDAVRAGIEAWKTMQAHLRELASLNQQRVVPRRRRDNSA